MMENISRSKDEYNDKFICLFFKHIYRRNRMWTVRNNPVEDKDLESSVFKTIGLTAEIINYIRNSKGLDMSIDDEAQYIYDELKNRKTENSDGKSFYILKKLYVLLTKFMESNWDPDVLSTYIDLSDSEVLDTSK